MKKILFLLLSVAAISVSVDASAQNDDDNAAMLAAWLRNMSRVEHCTIRSTVLDADRFVIACGEGALRFTEVQLEGSRRMSAEEFLRGKKIFVGRSLTAN